MGQEKFKDTTGNIKGVSEDVGDALSDAGRFVTGLFK